jgi:predicted transcriptional regulator
MITSSTPLLLSMKPRYADLVFGGQKKVELRRRSLKRMQGREALVYATTPARMLRGGFRIGEVWTGTLENIWSLVSDSAGVEKPDFDAYYAGSEMACALEIVDVWEYENPLTLDALKSEFKNFVVPQSWRYLKPDEHRIFQDMGLRIGFEIGDGSRPIKATVRYAH